MTDTLEQAQNQENTTTEEAENKPKNLRDKLIKDIVELLNEADPGDAVNAMLTIFPKSIDAMCSIYKSPQQIADLDQHLKNCFFNSSLNLHKRFMDLIKAISIFNNAKKAALEELAQQSAQEVLQQEQAAPEAI